ncbi:flagellar hook-basal body complex protein FliE [Parapusillimonas granuli]|mgnify:CR=1 FL=1|uniref:Flagellar hook-basal body complex protein FliE n=1 Tax=Parapusillimonas granuli TaxID=380911 RepID=A0A853G716_9BURK|nr:flagellar hook-basal body complex protein FliE [Parapusillimonas granuli]MBB5213372.1 flagellar hook-basal body complex protein FliE [Parapusillimonas granuli]MEB2398472.1 flagellar hook-basal body complex protein FliE [Alcaligenaceae bacterium]NYT51927.1 flagellar hook-basal body complex protein FliE [Parapusillimonas granuli]
MAIQHLTAIENMLAQMRAVANAAASVPARAQAAGPEAGGGFAAELSRSLERVSAMQNASAAQARAFQMGAPDISLNDVMIDMQKAGIAFQATLQMRNKLVQAYQEIASMPV